MTVLDRLGRFRAKFRAQPDPLVLVIDDEPGIRVSLRKFLARSRFRVDVASNLDDAAHMLFHSDPAAIILDMLFVNAGGRSGLDILQFIRGDERLADVPVIVLTGHELGPHVVSQIDALRAELWRKPVSYRELIARLDRLTGRDDPADDEPS